MADDGLEAEIRIEIVAEDVVRVKESQAGESTEALDYRLRTLHKAIDDGLSDLVVCAGGQIELGEYDSVMHYSSTLGEG